MPPDCCKVNNKIIISIATGKGLARETIVIEELDTFLRFPSPPPFQAFLPGYISLGESHHLGVPVDRGCWWDFEDGGMSLTIFPTSVGVGTHSTCAH